MHMQSCCLANLNLLLICRCRCLCSLLMGQKTGTLVIAKRRNVSEEIAGRNKYVFWAYVKFRLSVQSNEKFCCLENVCYQYLNFVLRVLFCFLTSC